MDSRGYLMDEIPIPVPALLGCCVAVALSAIGCDKSSVATYPASGVVTFDDGTPVPFGVIELRQDRGGHIARGKLDRSGKFELGTFSNDDGAVAGRHRAIIVQHLTPERPAASGGGRTLGSNEHARHQTALVAPEFASYETSGLMVVVEPVSANVPKLTVRRFTFQRNPPQQ